MVVSLVLGSGGKNVKPPHFTPCSKQTNKHPAPCTKQTIQVPGISRPLTERPSASRMNSLLKFQVRGSGVQGLHATFWLTLHCKLNAIIATVGELSG